MRRAVLLVALGASAAVAMRVRAAGPELCVEVCPAGTRVSAIRETEYTQAEAENGTFLYVTDTCEAYCEPVVPCILPNVPVVDDAGFRCQPLVGLGDFEPIDAIDFSFGASWDPAQAVVE